MEKAQSRTLESMDKGKGSKLIFYFEKNVQESCSLDKIM